ncbi:MAG: ARMT1-like domain-containing protein [Sphaerochaetaceae bacterium]|nr:ARMT1-like domain-containing protein [Sphaerochaetaceae bacterium]MDC7246807.1 ARMT1-like domain-containing protein [Sphaerochaetaceae bacterium]
MNTFTSCIPCFFHQVEEAKVLFSLDDAQTRQIMNILGDSLKHYTDEQSPPELAVVTQRELERVLGCDDPYDSIKKESNEKALRMYPQLKESVISSKDPLRKAIELSCGGNIIDYGVLGNTLDVRREIERIVSDSEAQINDEDPSLFSIDHFRERLRESSTVLFIADNAGEIVFDRLLIETIHEKFPSIRITVAVRGRPILNDALIADALSVHIDETARVITSGVPTPGTVLSLSTAEFEQEFSSSDMVISKGQGNYESLSKESREIFFLLTAKCHVIADDIGCNLKDLILLARNLKDESF